MKKPYKCVKLSIPDNYIVIQMTKEEFQRYFRGIREIDMFANDNKIMVIDREYKVAVFYEKN